MPTAYVAGQKKGRGLGEVFLIPELGIRGGVTKGKKKQREKTTWSRWIMKTQPAGVKSCADGI